MITRINSIVVTLFLFLSLLIVPSPAMATPIHHSAPIHHVVPHLHKLIPWYQPILNLPKYTLPMWRCILYRESTSTFAHPNLGDNNPYGSSGVFQIEQSTFAAHQASVGIPYSIKVWGAGLYLQARVAAAIWLANGFSQWTLYDGC